MREPAHPPLPLVPRDGRNGGQAQQYARILSPDAVHALSSRGRHSVFTVLLRRCAAAAELAVGAGWHALLLSCVRSIAARGVMEVPFFHACMCLHRCAVHDSARARHCVDVLPSSEHCIGAAVPVLRHLVTYFVPHCTILKPLWFLWNIIFSIYYTRVQAQCDYSILGQPSFVLTLFFLKARNLIPH